MRASQVLFLGAIGVGCLGKKRVLAHRDHMPRRIYGRHCLNILGSLRGLLVSFPEEYQPLGGVVTSDVPWNLEMRHWNLFALGAPEDRSTGEDFAIQPLP